MKDFNEIINRAKFATRRQDAPAAAGARVSPQHPGQSPEQKDVPEQSLLTAPLPNSTAPRPLTQAGTTGGALDMLEPVDEALTIADFEMGNVPEAELRGAYPWQQPLLRPVNGFRFDQGIVSLPPGEQVEAIEG